MQYNLANIPPAQHEAFTEVLDYLNECQRSADYNDNAYRKTEVRGIIKTMNTLGYHFDWKKDRGEGYWDLR